LHIARPVFQGKTVRSTLFFGRDQNGYIYLFCHGLSRQRRAMPCRARTTQEHTMINNDVMRSVRYMVDLSDKRIVDILKLADFEAQKEDVASRLKKDEEEGYAECDDKTMAHFLNGLVIFKRGKDDTRAPQPTVWPVTNNTVLKKLRVAFELKEDDMHTILAASGFEVSKPELSALFRKEGQKNYRACGDQLLRNFLKGLTLRVRGPN